MNARNLIGGFIAGAAIGVAAGLLMAPYSGEKARRKLIRGSAKIKKNVANYVENSLDTIRTQFNDKIDRITKAGKDTFNHAAEKVKM
jgi:gas vesicle protein